MGKPKRSHLIIPDTQVKPGLKLDYLEWIGKYIANRKPDTVIHLGDHWDMPSLSSYDRGLRSFEGRRYHADVNAGNEGMDRLLKGMGSFKPRMIFLIGNHEERIERMTQAHPELDGTLGISNLNLDRWEVHKFLDPVTIDGIKYCLAPDHEVLTDDLRYVRLGDLELGDTLLAFDEYGTEGRPRQYKSSTVLAHKFAVANRFKVHLSDGSSVTATADHRWLGRKNGHTEWDWFHTYELIPGIEFPRLFKANVSRLETHDAGWLGGVFDGEGHLHIENAQIGFSQNPGNVLARSEGILRALGIPFRTFGNGRDPIQHVRILGSSATKIELLMRIRPERLIEKFRPEMLGRVQAPKDLGFVSVLAIEAIGAGEIVQIQTSTQTMVVDGLPHHNCHYFPRSSSGAIVQTKRGAPNARAQLIREGGSCTAGHQQGLDVSCLPLRDRLQWGMIAGSCYPHEEAYLSPQGTTYWRGVIVKHEVNQGEYNPMFVSLDYLKRQAT